MPAGLQLFNDNGFVQIDDSYRNFHLVQKGTVSGSPVATYAGLPVYALTYSGNSPVLALRNPSGAFFRFLYAGRSGSTFTFYIWCSGTLPTYYIFDLLSGSAPTHGEGIEIFTAAGERAFSNAYDYMKVTAYVPFAYSAGAGIASQKIMNLPAGRDIAFAITSTAPITYDEEDVGSYPAFWRHVYIGMLYHSGLELWTNPTEVFLDYFGSGAGFIGTWTGVESLLCLDVTGL